LQVTRRSTVKEEGMRIETGKSKRRRERKHHEEGGRRLA
jgi:hypothetical protein